MQHAGMVTFVGKPNAGKSTLLNRVVGEKLSIVSSKPQTTRDRVVGIISDDDTQMIILDTPGLLNPRYALHRAMQATALDALKDGDIIVHLIDVADPDWPTLTAAAQLDHPPAAPVLTALNKVDTLGEDARARARERAAGRPGETFLISATTGEGVDELIARIRELLPETPFFYPADDISTHSMRFLVSELIRESALDLLEEELPYSVACEIDEFREDRSPLYIRAVLYVERESQKGILIGSGGAQIKELGRISRLKIEQLVGQRVYLELWVKVLANWRKNPRSLSRFGYRVPEDQPS